MRSTSTTFAAVTVAALVMSTSAAAAPGTQAVLSGDYHEPDHLSDIDIDKTLLSTLTLTLTTPPDQHPFHTSYHPLTEIAHFTAALAAQFPDRVRRVALGHSAEGREMEALHIGDFSRDGGEEEEEGEGDVVDEEDDEEEEEAMKKKKKSKKSKKHKNKKAFVITGAQHAREWIATASVLHLAHALVSPSSSSNVTSSSSSGSLSHLITHFDFHIIPVPNPDGYAYTWEPEGERLWYKNRMPLGPGKGPGKGKDGCTGLDLNRNWGYQWSPSSDFVEGDGPLYNVSFPLTGEDWDVFGDHPLREDFSSKDVLGTQKKKKKDDDKGKKKNKKPTPTPAPPPPVAADPCSHWYPGRRPFEAPEVNNIANYITLVPRLKAFLDLRAYGQTVSIPYAYTCSAFPPDAEDLYEAAFGMAAAASRTARALGAPVNYGVARLCEALYPAPGGILDWMYGPGSGSGSGFGFGFGSASSESSERSGVVGAGGTGTGAGRAKHAFAVHLRDTGTYGYALPPEMITVVGREVGAMVGALAGFVQSGGSEDRW